MRTPTRTTLALAAIWFAGVVPATAAAKVREAAVVSPGIPQLDTKTQGDFNRFSFEIDGVIIGAPLEITWEDMELKAAG